MSTGPTNLFDLCTALLAACVDIYEGYDGITAPSLQYVYGAGEPVAACDQLVVAWQATKPNTPTFAENPMWVNPVMSRRANLVIMAYRCLTDIPQGGGFEVTDPEPVPARATYDAQAIMTDAYILPKGIVAAHYAGTFGNFASGLAIANVVPIQADGGVGGCRLDIEAELS